MSGSAHGAYAVAKVMKICRCGKQIVHYEVEKHGFVAFFMCGKGANDFYFLTFVEDRLHLGKRKHVFIALGLHYHAIDLQLKQY